MVINLTNLSVHGFLAALCLSIGCSISPDSKSNASEDRTRDGSGSKPLRVAEVDGGRTVQGAESPNVIREISRFIVGENLNFLSLFVSLERSMENQGLSHAAKKIKDQLMGTLGIAEGYIETFPDQAQKIQSDSSYVAAIKWRERVAGPEDATANGTLKGPLLDLYLLMSGEDQKLQQEFKEVAVCNNLANIKVFLSLIGDMEGKDFGRVSKNIQNQVKGALLIADGHAHAFPEFAPMIQANESYISATKRERAK